MRLSDAPMAIRRIQGNRAVTTGQDQRACVSGPSTTSIRCSRSLIATAIPNALALTMLEGRKLEEKRLERRKVGEPGRKERVKAVSFKMPLDF